MALSQVSGDLNFLMTDCATRYVPCHVTLDDAKGKYTKIPACAKWTTVTPARSRAIAAQRRFTDWRHFLFVTGKTSGVFALDLDRKNPQRVDHADKIDGIEFYEERCGPVDTPDTLTLRSIGGGYHKIYKLTPELEGLLHSKQLTPLVLIDVLYDGRGFMFGDGCSIVHRMVPQVPPPNIVQFIVNNSVTNNVQINLTHIDHRATAPPSALSECLHEVYGTPQIAWTLKKLDNAYQLIPATYRCCVDLQHVHSTADHSCLYVRKNSVTATCFSHGKRLLEGPLSRTIRELFYTFADNATDPVTTLINAVMTAAKAQRLIRENGAVMKRLGETHAYAYVGTYEEFVRQQLQPHDALVRAQPRRFNEVMLYMQKMDHVDFPRARRDRRFLSFTNGILDLIDGELVGPEVLQDGVIPRHHIDQPCQFDALDTPRFDQIVRYQLDDDVVYTYLLALIGRLLYSVRQFDTFDIVPFIIGDVNTGKSTLINIVCAMFAPDRVGVLDSTHEMIFGLQSKYDKEILVASEITDKMAQQLSSDLFRKMVCGERVNLPQKHAAALASVPWQVPLFLCGNDYLGYPDERGSISKRLAIFRFTRYVPQRNDALESQIIQHELAPLIVKSLLAYRQLLQHADTRGFWETCPDYFRDTRNEMNETTDYIAMFLTLGPDGNAWSNKSMYFMRVPGREMLLEDFKKKFANYMRFRHPHVKHRWKQDYSAFKRLGYDVTYTHVCKSCLTNIGPGCCPHYHNANRSKRYVIKHIVCVEQATDDY